MPGSPRTAAATEETRPARRLCVAYMTGRPIVRVLYAQVRDCSVIRRERGRKQRGRRDLVVESRTSYSRTGRDEIEGCSMGSLIEQTEISAASRWIFGGRVASTQRLRA